MKASSKLVGRREAALMGILVVLVLLGGFLASRPRELVEGVWTVDVPGRCSLDYHASARALALACPGVDYVRLWPLPLVQAWEEPGGPVRGQLARIGQRRTVSR